MNLDWLSVALVSVSMSVDAIVVNATNGLKEINIKKRKLFLIALSFGFFQFMMPLIGYFIGFAFKPYLESIKIVIPIIAFSLLTLLSLHSFIDWVKDFKNSKKIKKEENELSYFYILTNDLKIEEEKDKRKKITFLDILIEDIATSIDALCLGFVYLNLSINQALVVFSIVGIVTFILPFIAGIFGKKIAVYLEKWAPLIASIVFLAVGLKILIEGLI